MNTFTTSTNARRLTAKLAAPMAACLMTLSASAAVSSVAGQAQLISAPAACGWGQLTGFAAQVWDEQQGVTFFSSMDMVNNPGNSNTAIAGTLGGTYNSHFIHFESVPGIVNAQGSVTFDAAIVGVIFNKPLLDSTDAGLGAGGTVYPTGYAFRGLSSNPPSFFSISGNTLTFNLNSVTPSLDVVQIRVITHLVPAPGSIALLGAAGMCGIRRRR